MNMNRVNNIKEPFKGITPNMVTPYTRQELLELLLEFQKAMASGVYEKTHAKYMRDQDVMIHFAALAERHGLKDTETYKRFERNMNDLGYTIGTFIKGMQGERIAKKALKALKYDRDVVILYNVALEDEEAQAEYDSIVIAPYGMFPIEVKNWGTEMHIDKNGILKRKDQDIKYDLAGRMSVKEGLLREYLGESFPEQYQGIVLFPSENVKVDDDYGQIPIFCGGGIAYHIRSFAKTENLLGSEQIKEIAQKIIDNHKEQRTLCKVNCEELLEDYASLMAAIEEAADDTYSSIEEVQNQERVVDTEPKVEEVIPERKKIERKEEKAQMILNGLSTVACVVGAIGAVTAVAKIFSRKG